MALDIGLNQVGHDDLTERLGPIGGDLHRLHNQFHRCDHGVIRGELGILGTNCLV